MNERREEGAEAALHRIAYGRQQKHGKHKVNHTKLMSYLRGVGEPDLANQWDAIEKRRTGEF